LVKKAKQKTQQMWQCTQDVYKGNQTYRNRMTKTIIVIIMTSKTSELACCKQQALWTWYNVQ